MSTENESSDRIDENLGVMRTIILGRRDFEKKESIERGNEKLEMIALTVGAAVFSLIDGKVDVELPEIITILFTLAWLPSSVIHPLRTVEDIVNAVVNVISDKKNDSIL